jgi:thioesterase domain-containing protein/acyl carrier protein
LNLNGKLDRRALPTPSFVRGEKEFVEPRNTLEAQLAAIWESALKIEPIGVTDDFFEIGGDSILALRVFTEIQKITGKNLPLATLFQTPTIEQLATALRQDGWKPNWAPIVAVQPHGSRPPFFCVHGGFGGVLFYGQLARCLGAEQPLYGLQAEGLDGGPINHPTIPSMATYYLSEMCRVQPHGPYFFGGYSFGGVVAFEMAHQLHASGEEVALLVLFDSSDYENRPQRHSLTHLIRLGLQARGFSPPVEKLQTLLRRTWSKLTTSLVERLQGAQNLPGQTKPAATPPSAVQVVQMSNLHAISIYQPRAYPGRVTLFRAEDPDDGYAHSADYGWTKFAESGIEIHNVPGGHEAIFSPPNVRVLAEKLDACIRAALGENIRG